MVLTPEQLQMFAAALRVSGPQSAESERRRTQRLDVRANVEITLMKGDEKGDTLTLRLRDLSPRGVALLHTQPLERGQQFLLTLPRTHGEGVTILCTAMHSKTGTGTLHTIGAEFTCAVNDQAIRIKPSESEMDRIRKSFLD